jgi:hypothetical protein
VGKLALALFLGVAAIWFAVAVGGPPKTRSDPDQAERRTDLVYTKSSGYTLTCHKGEQVPVAVLEQQLLDPSSPLAREASRASSDARFIDAGGAFAAKGWRYVRGTPEELILTHDDDLGNQYRIDFTRKGGKLALAGSSFCNVSAPNFGGGVEDWFVEPAIQIGSNTTSFPVLMEDGMCDGEDLADRIYTPHVVYAKRAVIVTFIRTQRTPTPPDPNGNSVCLGVGLQPRPDYVRLREPLGDRVLMDGRTYPPEPANQIPGSLENDFRRRRG